MSDLMIDSLREAAFSQIDQNDREIRPLIEQLAQRIAALPDTASLAPDKAFYLIGLLQRIEQIIYTDDPIPCYETTLSKLAFAILARLNPNKPEWPEEQ